MHTTNSRGASSTPGILVAVAAIAALALAFAPMLGGQSPVSSGPPAYVAGQVLVRFTPGAPAAERAQARAAVNAAFSMSYSIVPDLERLTLHPGRTVEEAVAALEHNPNVLYVEPDYVVNAAAIPNDPSFGSLWGMANIRAPAAWDTTTGDRDVVVAIIDTGIDRTHPDLQGNLWTNPGEIANNGVDDDGNGYVDDLYGWDFAYNDNDPSDGNNHGTHVAGTIGARGDNGLGVVGVNWQVKLVGLKFLNNSGSGSTSNAILALQYACDAGIRVSNNSWGGGGYSQALYDAIKAAKSTGHLFVAAAGNGGADGVGDNNDLTPFYPSSYNLDNLIAVASITSADARSSFSNYGAASVDLGAPGSSIYSTLPGGKYGTYSGTSMATPHVSGAVAMLMGLHPTWTYGQVRDAIRETARPLSALAGTTVTGGTLDLAAAVAYSPVTSPPAAPNGLSASSPSSTQVTLGWTDNSGDESGFSIERSTDGALFAQIATVGASVTTYTDSGLAPSTDYWYRVSAFNGAGSSGGSEVVSVRTQDAPSVPAAPTLISVTPSPKMATLVWGDVIGETGYDVGRANYNTRSKSCGTLNVIKSVGAGVTSTTDLRSGGGTYCYAVRAFNTGGTSGWSNVMQVTILKK